MEPKPMAELHTINLGILLKNSKCFAICFSSILVMSLQISITRLPGHYTVITACQT